MCRVALGFFRQMVREAPDLVTDCVGLHCEPLCIPSFLCVCMVNHSGNPVAFRGGEGGREGAGG